MIAIIWHMTTISPGMKKLAERVSGLKRMRGRASMGMPVVLSSCLSDSCKARALLTLSASPATLDSEPSTSTRICADRLASSCREKSSGILMPTRALPEMIIRFISSSEKTSLMMRKSFEFSKLRIRRLLSSV